MKKLMILTLVLFAGLTTQQALWAKSMSPTAGKQLAIQKVNINKAGAREIAQVLSGIGTQKAQAIVAYRAKHGVFKSVAELAAVKGIGVRTLERNHDKILL